VLKKVQTEVHLNKAAEYIVKGVQRAVFSNILKYGLEFAPGDRENWQFMEDPLKLRQ
jgi:hypothetical protein